LKSPEEIIQTISDNRQKFSQKKATVGVIRGIIQEAKTFFSSLSGQIIDSINKNIFRVTVENQINPPEVQKIDGEVSIKDMRALVLGLDEIIKSLSEVKTSAEKNTKAVTKDLKPEKVDFSGLEKAIKAIKFPEIKIPEQRKSVEVSNLSELKKYFDGLIKKFDVPTPVVNIPPFPEKIEVSNFPKPEEQEKEEKMTGFYWKKDENNNVTEIVEQYPSGDVVSTGWDIGRVKIDDRRIR